MTEILRLAAFTDRPDGGNPAGVVLDASALDDAAMLAIAADLGYAESAFVVGPPTPDDPGAVRIRYFAPAFEVPFCGHATIATAVALAERAGTPDTVFRFDTRAGEVRITTSAGPDGRPVAAFTSVEPVVTSIAREVLERLLGLLHLTESDLLHPAMLSFAGNTHPVIVVADRAVFDAFTFDPAPMRALMDEQGWAGTVTVLTPTGADSYEARNPFPVGDITEDPATGSAAAATGGYLRAMGLVDPPVRITIAQGRHVGRPGLLTVDIPEIGGIVVSGGAVPIPV